MTFPNWLTRLLGWGRKEAFRETVSGSQLVQNPYLSSVLQSQRQATTVPGMCEFVDSYGVVRSRMVTRALEIERLRKLKKRFTHLEALQQEDRNFLLRREAQIAAESKNAIYDHG